MKAKKIVIWWLANGKEHPFIEQEEKKISSLMPLVEALFPGINYYSMSGFGDVMRTCGMPALKKRFPELLTMSEEDIAREATAEVEITEFLPSKGYEWSDDPAWMATFQERLTA
jgi:hypothetical protein